MHASGHGPVFGAATPTLGKGGWSFDQALNGQAMDGSGDTSALLRSMISFGITEKLQISQLTAHPAWRLEGDAVGTHDGDDVRQPGPRVAPRMAFSDTINR